MDDGPCIDHTIHSSTKLEQTCTPVPQIEDHFSNFSEIILYNYSKHHVMLTACKAW